MEENSTTPGPLRKTLHRPAAGVAPSYLEEAMTISASTGASHFQKMPGNKMNALIWSEWRLTVIAATVRIALVDILDLSEVDIPAGVFLHPAVGWG